MDCGLPPDEALDRMAGLRHCSRTAEDVRQASSPTIGLAQRKTPSSCKGLGGSSAQSGTYSAERRHFAS
eukprot:9354070-Alexandrium_andersonii.AAC.1